MIYITYTKYFAMIVYKVYSKVGLRVPVIIPMKGTNLQQGRKILEDAGTVIESHSTGTRQEE